MVALPGLTHWLTVLSAGLIPCPREILLWHEQDHGSHKNGLSWEKIQFTPKRHFLLVTGECHSFVPPFDPIHLPYSDLSDVLNRIGRKGNKGLNWEKRNFMAVLLLVADCQRMREDSDEWYSYWNEVVWFATWQYSILLFAGCGTLPSPPSLLDGSINCLLVMREFQQRNLWLFTVPWFLYRASSSSALTNRSTQREVGRSLWCQKSPWECKFCGRFTDTRVQWLIFNWRKLAERLGPLRFSSSSFSGNRRWHAGGRRWWWASSSRRTLTLSLSEHYIHNMQIMVVVDGGMTRRCSKMKRRWVNINL